MLAIAPKLFGDLAHALPLSALLKLSDKFGGTRVHIPLQPVGSSGLDLALNQDEFETLCKEYGGERFEIPKATRLRKRLRDGEICALFDKGSSIRALAINFKLTERHIFRIAAKNGIRRHAPPQIKAGGRLVQPMKSGGTSR